MVIAAKSQPIVPRAERDCLEEVRARQGKEHELRREQQLAKERAQEKRLLAEKKRKEAEEPLKEAEEPRNKAAAIKRVRRLRPAGDSWRSEERQRLQAPRSWRNPAS